METKRASGGCAGRPSKKSRTVTVDLVPVVVDALKDAEALPADLRTLFGVALPIVLNANKADRHAYESEVVEQAEKALVSVQTALEQKHADALKIQNEVIAPAEQQKRTAAKTEAEAGLEAVRAKLEASEEVQSAARKAVHDAKGALKPAQKDAASSEKEMQGHADKKTILSDLLANEFKALQVGTSGTPKGKLAVKKLEKCGKECNLDAILLKTFPLTCIKEPSTRSEFEMLMFTSLKAAINKQIDGHSDKINALETSKAEKLAAVANAKINLEKEEAAATAASGEVSATQGDHRDAEKQVRKADDALYQIWGDMKKACDAQDDLAMDIKNFTENVLTAFQKLKEKEPEPVEAEEDAAVEEEAAVPMEAEPAAEEAVEEPEPVEAEEDAAVEEEAAVPMEAEPAAEEVVPA